MGDPRKHRRKYSTPPHPWQKTRIDEERILLNDYGLKNKKEIWRSTSLLKKFRSQAKSLIATKTEQSKKEEKLLIKKLANLSLLDEKAHLGDILGLTLKDILERRLQTVVYRKNLARSIDQSRQFVVHGHVVIENKKITLPSYLVKKNEEDKINFISNSTLHNSNHPERVVLEKEEKQNKEIENGTDTGKETKAA
jgi:small subunit ribosomal protein S4|tara:strand:+ start:19790 stop:20374 length:585 start_codon:yes stop_codon:yes gene_type:complete